MKFLFLSELFYPHGGGAEFATYLYAKLLIEEGHKVVVITNRFPGELDVSKTENMTIYRLPLYKENESVRYATFKRFDVLFSNLIRRLMNRCDIVYVPRFWHLAIALAKFYKKPVVTHLHDYIPLCPLAINYDLSKDSVCMHGFPINHARCIYAFEKTKGRSNTKLFTSILLNSTLGRYLSSFVKFSDAIICVSKAQRDIILSEKPSLSDKTHVVYNPLPEMTYSEIEDDDFAYFGGSNCLKGFSILYKAMVHLNQLNNVHSKIHATKFPSYFKMFNEKYKRLGIVFYKKLDKTECKDLYKHIRAVVVPSMCPEPWPYVVVEAIMGGRFVIASNIGGIPEQVEGCKGAVLFESGNHIELAEAIDFVRGLKRESVIDLVIQNKETFFRRFNNQKTVSSFLKVCENLI